MRISDWSSDVCSSDLQLDAVLRAVPDAMLLSLGVVDGRNVWRSDLEALLDRIEPIAARRDLVLAPSCSLLHVPVDLALGDATFVGWVIPGPPGSARTAQATDRKSVV